MSIIPIFYPFYWFFKLKLKSKNFLLNCLPAAAALWVVLVAAAPAADADVAHPPLLGGLLVLDWLVAFPSTRRWKSIQGTWVGLALI